MSECHNWGSHSFDAYMHWHLRLDSSGDSTAGDSKTRLSDFALRAQKVGVALREQNPRALDIGLFPIVRELSPPIDPAKLSVPPSVKVLVGVIDTDIPLGHRAFRHADGSSRVLYHWQMDFSAEKNGQDFTKDQIDTLLKEHSDCDLTGPLNAEAFNMAIGALQMAKPRGPHALLGRFSHGAHVLDLAGGANPGRPSVRNPDDSFAQEVGLVTIGMPPRWQFGEAGEFLDLMMLLGLGQVAHAARMLWSKSREDLNAPGIETAGFPTVVNLAFGRHAGSKRDDGGWVPVTLGQIKKSDAEMKQIMAGGAYNPAPLEVIMPAGNDNLGRVAARHIIGRGKAEEIAWRILPGDQTDNFVEIWAEGVPGPGREELDFKLALISPGQADAEAITIPIGQYCDVLVDRNGKFAARLYRLTEPSKDEKAAIKRPGYLLALGPSDPRTKDFGAVPAGLWRVRFETDLPNDILVETFVQTDQSTLPVAGIAGRSYLDGAVYEVHDCEGRLKDAVKWDGRGWVRNEPWHGVLRHGSINAAASHSLAETVAGYRQSDGMPAIYSATGVGVDADPKQLVRTGPTAALVTDTSTVLVGTLAAGANDGGKVSMQGTSFAAARATRLVAEEWLRTSGSTLRSAACILRTAAIDHEKADEKPYPDRPYLHEDDRFKAAYSKFGYGRIPDRMPSTSADPPRRGY